MIYPQKDKFKTTTKYTFVVINHFFPIFNEIFNTIKNTELIFKY